jgi:hypothetical protein
MTHLEIWIACELYLGKLHIAAKLFVLTPAHEAHLTWGHKVHMWRRQTSQYSYFFLNYLFLPVFFFFCLSIVFPLTFCRSWFFRPYFSLRLFLLIRFFSFEASSFLYFFLLFFSTLLVPNVLQPLKYLLFIIYLSVYLFISFSLSLHDQLSPPFLFSPPVSLSNIILLSSFLYFQYIHVDIPPFFSSAAVSVQALTRYQVPQSHLVTW